MPCDIAECHTDPLQDLIVPSLPPALHHLPSNSRCNTFAGTLVPDITSGTLTPAMSSTLKPFETITDIPLKVQFECEEESCVDDSISVDLDDDDDVIEDSAYETPEARPPRRLLSLSEKPLFLPLLGLCFTLILALFLLFVVPAL